MTRLRDLSLDASYDKAFDNIADSFYLPCMRASSTYDRVSGYFSSAVFTIAWPALKEFVAGDGRMRLLCSPVFSASDGSALREGYAALTDDELAQSLISELNLLLESGRSRKPAQVFAGLIATGVIEVKIALVADAAGPGDRRIFHDKVGLFGDESGDVVGFRGSMNETYLGLSPDGNLESIDVFPSWEGGRDADRVAAARQRFELLWDNQVGAVDVRAMPEAAVTVIRQAAPSEWEVLIDEVVAEAAIRARSLPNLPPLRDHQTEALGAWELNQRQRRGLLEHATGSGKTFTALNGMRSAFLDGGVGIVLVPSALLLAQWHDEVMRVLGDLHPQVLLAGDGHDSWRVDDLLFPWTRPGLTSSRLA